MLWAILVVLLVWITGCKNNSKEGVLAEIDGYQILEEDFNEEFEMKKKIFVKQFGEDFLNQELEEGLTVEAFLREELLFELIHENVLEKELDKLNITISEEDIDGAMKESYIDKLGGEEGYNEYLNYLGVSDEFLRKSVTRKLIYQRYSEYFFEQIDLSEDELREYYENNKDSFVKVRASHILVKTEEEGKEILKRLKEGENFASLAATRSLDTQTSVQGGDLGYFAKGSIANDYKEIEDTAFNLKVGEVSGLIKTDFGYHIVLVEDRMESFEDLEEEVTKALKNEKYQGELESLTEKANVEVYMDLHRDK